MTRAATSATGNTAGGSPERDRAGTVAVVCVTHNSVRLLPDFVASVPERVAAGPVEIHIVDSGSTDATPDEARRLCPGGEVQVMNGNRGFAAGINTAAAALARRNRPPIAVLIVNPDTRFTPRTIDALVEALRSRPEVGIAVPRLLDAEGGLQLSLRRAPSLSATWAEAICGGPLAHRLGMPTEVVRDRRAYDTAIDVGWATGGFLAVSWECLEAVGEWDESYFLYSEETDFALRSADLGYPTVFEPAAEAIHLRGGSSTNARLWPLLCRNRVRLHRKRHGLLPAVAFYLVLVVREGSRAALGRDVSRAALRYLLDPRCLLRAPGPWSVSAGVTPQGSGGRRLARHDQGSLGSR